MNVAIHAARLRISHSYLRQMLGIPDEARILAVQQDWSTQGEFWVVIEHPYLPPVVEGEEIPAADLLISEDYEQLTRSFSLRCKGEEIATAEQKVGRRIEFRTSREKR